MATLKTAADYAAELGRSQNAFQQYETAGRKDLQTGASGYADKLRKAATSAGVDLSGYGTQNKYGTDYTSYANGAGGAYDPSKTGLVEKTPTKVDTGGTGNGGDAVPSVGGGGGGGYSGQSTPSGPSPSDLINSAYQNNYAAQLQKLRSARDQSLAALAGQDDLVHQTAYNGRNNNDVMAQMGLRRTQEANAASGINGGDSVTAQIANNTDRQNGANSINMNEGNQIKQLQAQRGAINNNMNADDLALMQQLQGARDTALVGQGNVDRSYGLDLSRLSGQLPGGGGQTLDALNASRNYGLGLAGLSGQLPGGGQTLAAQQFGWGQNMDLAGLTGNYNGSRTLAGQNADMNKTQLMASLTGHMPDGTPTTAEQQRSLDNMWKAAETNGTIPDELAQMYGIPKGTKTIDAQLRLAQANYYNDHGNYYNNRMPGSSGGQQPPSAQSMSKYFDGMARRDKNGNLTNSADLESSILNSPLSDFDAYQTYLRFGLNWTGPIPTPN